jgi:crossover junction endodeoxyribonuclease RusA
MLISKKGREYRMAVAELVAANPVKVEGSLKVTIEAFRPDRRKRDLDNLFKATLDSLTHAGVWEDDSQIVDLRIYWAPILGGMLKVTVENSE